MKPSPPWGRGLGVGDYIHSPIPASLRAGAGYSPRVPLAPVILILSPSKDEDEPRTILRCEWIWVPACAGNTKAKQGPHPTLSLRERAKKVKALAPLGERVG